MNKENKIFLSVCGSILAIVAITIFLSFGTKDSYAVNPDLGTGEACYRCGSDYVWTSMDDDYCAPVPEYGTKGNCVNANVEYSIEYYQYGGSAFTSLFSSLPTTAHVGDTITINNPVKRVVLSFSTDKYPNATIQGSIDSNSITKELTFDGWTSSDLWGLGSNAKVGSTTANSAWNGSTKIKTTKFKE